LVSYFLTLKFLTMSFSRDRSKRNAIASDPCVRKAEDKFKENVVVLNVNDNSEKREMTEGKIFPTCNMKALTTRKNRESKKKGTQFKRSEKAIRLKQKTITEIKISKTG
jgi:hypothetical protein